MIRAFMSARAVLAATVLAAFVSVACQTSSGAGGASSSKAPATAAQTASKAAVQAAAPETTADGKPLATATLGMGCFWCAETAYETLPGIVSVVSGYAGGRKDKPTYHEVSAGGTGHAEVIQIRFDPARISYQRILDIFWHSIDPTQAGGQFCDRGSQYRSVIFTHDAEQKRLAEASRNAIAASRALKSPIVTEIAPAPAFYPAEDYHQDFWKKDPGRYTSYREGCGRDRRLREIWGDAAAKPAVH